MCTSKTQGGISLVELIIFIIIVSVGVAGILSVMNVTVMHSAEPMLRKQAVAIAESLLEKSNSSPSTWCDPDDANATTATGAADCAHQGRGTEARGGVCRPGSSARAATRMSMAAIPRSITSTITTSLPWRGYAASTTALPLLPNLGDYNANVSISEVGAAFGLAAGDALRIDVQVTGPGGTDITLSGYRFRYAPRAAAVRHEERGLQRVSRWSRR